MKNPHSYSFVLYIFITIFLNIFLHENNVFWLHFWRRMNHSRIEQSIMPVRARSVNALMFNKEALCITTLALFLLSLYLFVL